MTLWKKGKGVWDALARTGVCICGRHFPRTSVVRLAQVSLPPPQPPKLSHKTLHRCFFFCSRHSLTHLWEASSKMSLPTNLLGFCHYLPGTQLREERGRLQGRLPGELPSPLLSRDVPKCLQGAGCLPSVALPHAPLLPRACPEALSCLEGEFFRL